MKTFLIILVTLFFATIVGLLYWQNIQLEEKNKALEYILNISEEETRKMKNQNSNKADLDWCLNKAELDRDEYLKLNGEIRQEDGNEIISANDSIWKRADERLDVERNNCYRRYKE